MPIICHASLGMCVGEGCLCATAAVVHRLLGRRGGLICRRQDRGLALHNHNRAALFVGEHGHK